MGINPYYAPSYTLVFPMKKTKAHSQVGLDIVSLISDQLVNRVCYKVAL